MLQQKSMIEFNFKTYQMLFWTYWRYIFTSWCQKMILGADIGDPAHYSYRCTVIGLTVYTYSRGSLWIFTVRSRHHHASALAHPQVLLFTGDRRMPRWQYFFFFFVCGRLFVISHLMLTCKLLRARVTIADDSFVLSPLRLWLLMLWFSRKSTLAETQMRPREKTPSGKHPQGSSPWTSGQSGSCGRFWPKQMLLFSKFKVCLSASSNSIVLIFYASKSWWIYWSLVCFWSLVSSGDLFVWQSCAKWQKCGEEIVDFVCLWSTKSEPFSNPINPKVFWYIYCRSFSYFKTNHKNKPFPKSIISLMCAYTTQPLCCCLV